MTKILFLTILVYSSRIVFGQDTLNIRLIWEQSFKGNIIGSIDEQQNSILFDGTELIKLNSQGEMLFHQSIKSLGKIKEIDARNPFKILLFSENQQSINFIDNSLTLQNETIDLSDFNINNAVNSSGSDQMDKCWVYNQDNSELKLIGKNQQQFQSINNLKKMVNINTIDQLKEVNGQLFLLDYSGKVVILDTYGNLKSSFNVKAYTSAIIDNSIIYLQLEKITLVYNYIQNKVVGYIKTPSDITLIAKKGEFFFFTKENKLSKFTFAN